jgi:hypothetical protein
VARIRLSVPGGIPSVTIRGRETQRLHVKLILERLEDVVPNRADIPQRNDLVALGVDGFLSEPDVRVDFGRLAISDRIALTELLAPCPVSFLQPVDQSIRYATAKLLERGPVR